MKSGHFPTRPRRQLSLFTMLAVLLSCAAAPIAHALDTGDIVVKAIQGDVKFTIDGAPRALKAGAVLALPAIVTTGKDGSVELKQGATSIRVGPETELNFPATEGRRAPIDRIIQPKGNAFYDIGKRDGRKLRIETPVLVGVVKGTQFNVVAMNGATTISLFEGRLEILDMNGGAIDLAAGEIASRKRGDASTNVMKMQGAPGATPRTSSNTRAAAGEVTAGLPHGADAAPGDDVTSGLLASDLALAHHADAPSPVVGPVTAPEAPGNPAQPDVGVEAPVGTTPPPAEVPEVDTPPLIEAPGSDTPPQIEAPDSGTPPQIEVPGDVAIPPDLGVGELPVNETVPPTGTIPDLGAGPDPGEAPDLDIDDGNNGHGNDDDRDDSGNPGRGRSGRNR